MKLKPQVKQKWVAALRSTAYKQGTLQLRRRDNTFCCLGVLCNLHAQEHPEIAIKNRNPEIYDGESCFLSRRVSKWAGLDASGHALINLEKPLRWNRREYWCLVGANDDRVPFSAIADYIDRYL